VAEGEGAGGDGWVAEGVEAVVAVAGVGGGEGEEGEEGEEGGESHFGGWCWGQVTDGDGLAGKERGTWICWSVLGVYMIPKMITLHHTLYKIMPSV
jgi:hypothetical protein